MADFTLRQVQYFVAAVETGSVTAAAQRCHASQGAASMAINQLEKAVGAVLLVRNGPRTVVTTPAGQEFLEHARAILERVEEAHDAISESLTALRGKLRVGVGLTLSPRLVPQIIGTITQQHPQLDLTLAEGSPQDLEERVLSGRLDVAFLYRQQAGASLSVTELVPVRLHVILPEGHRLAGEREIWLRDLVREPAILLDVPPTADRILSTVHSVGLELNVRWRSASMETIRSLVASGLGFSFANSIPSSGEAFVGGAVVYRPVADRLPVNSIVSLTLPGRVPRRVQAVIDLVRSVPA